MKLSLAVLTTTLALAVSARPLDNGSPKLPFGKIAVRAGNDTDLLSGVTGLLDSTGLGGKKGALGESPHNYHDFMTSTKRIRASWTSPEA